jgi:hypothetical protein
LTHRRHPAEPEIRLHLKIGPTVCQGDASRFGGHFIAEHAVDMGRGAVTAVVIAAGDAGDTATIQ